MLILVIATWAAAEAALSHPDAPEPGTLALPTGIALFVGQLAAVLGGASGTAAGLAFVVAGVVLRLWAIRTLGGAFRTALDSPRLVATGPYRWLRHPSELGLVAIAAGGAIASASWLAGVAAVAIAVLAVVRCRRETAALRHTHGAPEVRSQRIVAEGHGPSCTL